MVSGYAWDKRSKDFFYSNWVKFTSLYAKYKLRYAYALGNHDHESDLNYEQIGELEKTNPYSLFTENEAKESDSLTNY